MSAPLCSLISKIVSMKRFALPVHAHFSRNFKFQSNFVPIDSKSCKFTKQLEEILDTVPPESAALSPLDTLNIFRGLGELTKQIKQPDLSRNVTSHKNFSILCQALESSMPYIELNGKFDILKTIKNLCVPVNSEAYSVVLMSFHENVFSMSLNEIMGLDRILCFIQRNQMVDDLRRSLIDQFNLKYSSQQIMFNYFENTRRMLQFIERNRHGIMDEVFKNLETCAATQNIDIFTAREAMEIIILLSSFGNRSESVWPILNKAFHVWCNSAATIQMVERALKVLVWRHRTGNDVHRYKDHRFIGKCAQTAMASGDVEKCFLVLRHLNQLEFTSKQLIDYLIKHLKDNRSHKNFVYNCATLAFACDIGDYKPRQFYEFLFPLLSSMNFHQQLDFNLDWPKLALTLLNLGIHHQPLITEILKRRSQFQRYYGFEALECHEMEQMINVNVAHLMPDMRHAIDRHVRFLACVDSSLVPMLVKIDIHSKVLLPFEDDNITINSISCPDNQLLIAVTGLDSHINLFGRNAMTIALDATEWTDLLRIRSHEALFNSLYSRLNTQNFDSSKMS